MKKVMANNMTKAFWKMKPNKKSKVESSPNLLPDFG